jgi:3-oxoacyl-[acyl-carrier protein] reductase
MNWLEGKTAIVTGSTRGIGFETARVLLQQGANVTVFCRHDTHGRAAEKELKTEGGHLLMTVGDVRSKSDVDRIVKETVDAFGTVDLLVNNAGIARWKLIEDTTEADFDATLETNLKGAWLFSRAVLPFMKKQKSGRIVHISSGLGLFGRARYSAYCASKFGLIGLNQTLHREVKKFHIVSVAMALGAVDTKLHRDMHPNENYSLMMKPDACARKIVAKALRERAPRGGSTIKLFIA